MQDRPQATVLRIDDWIEAPRDVVPSTVDQLPSFILLFFAGSAIATCERWPGRSKDKSQNPMLLSRTEMETGVR